MKKIGFISPFFCWILWTASIEAAEPKVCLTLMVQDDADVIRRCLDSVEKFVDCICVCDIGSSDATVEIIDKFMESKAIPGMVYLHRWVNGESNRALAIQTSQKMLKRLGYALSDCYLLVMEPDMVLQAKPSFTKESLSADSYLISEKSALGFSIYYPHFLRASLPWTSTGLIHGYWSSPAVTSSVKLHNVVLEELISEERMNLKLGQNIVLLEKALEKDPTNSTHMLYLAHSYRCLKQYEKAIPWYREHINKEWENRKWDTEEVWFSKYMIGECYEELGGWDQALYWYLDAYQQNPRRADSLKKVATHYRLFGQNHLAHIFAKYGSLIPRLDDPKISLVPPLDYQFDEELSISSYYTRFKEDGYDTCDALMLRKDIPDHVNVRAYQNMLFYVKSFPNTRFRTIDVALPLIQEGSDQCYNPMNPSIQRTPNGYKVICRTVNYTQIGAKIFNTIDKDGIFRTRNFLIEYDQNFNKLSQHEIIEDLTRERIRFVSIEGLDDCRIFDFNGNSWFTCTTNDTNPVGNFQISLCQLSDTPMGGNVYVDKLIPLNGPDPYRCEKNWLPFLDEGTLHVIYSYDPFVIYRPDLETGDCKMTLSYTPEYNFSHFRGSAGPLEWEDGFLVLVHEVVQQADYSRSYLHRFLYLDKNFTIKQLSKPFTFRHIGIEYCCSMTMDHTGRELVLAIGIEDREAYLCSMDIADVKASLKPLPPLNPPSIIK